MSNSGLGKSGELCAAYKVVSNKVIIRFWWILSVSYISFGPPLRPAGQLLLTDTEYCSDTDNGTAVMVLDDWVASLLADVEVCYCDLVGMTTCACVCNTSMCSVCLHSCTTHDVSTERSACTICKDDAATVRNNCAKSGNKMFSHFCEVAVFAVRPFYWRILYTTINSLYTVALSEGTV